MREKPSQKGWGRFTRLAGILVLCSVPILRTAVGENPGAPDPCELEAWKAYREALRLCEFEDHGTDNPRLRCYEAAKAVFVRTYLDCKRGKGPD
jgi:hypothetical protein